MLVKPYIDFYDKRSNTQMRYVYPDENSWRGWGGWILYKGGENQWVSLREATDTDIKAINDAGIMECTL